MAEDPGEAQARVLLRELYGHVADVSSRLEAVDEFNRRAYQNGSASRDPMASALRRDLYEAHRLIDGLHRRFPGTLPAERAQQQLGSTT